LLDSKTTFQILRYGLNGFLLNGIGYCFYLLATRYGLSPILAVTILYPIGIILSFFTHKVLTFKVVKSQKTSRELTTFITVYFLGYLLNVTLIYIFHNMLKLPHQVIQFCSIIIVAFFLFCLNKFIVFNVAINKS
jgi:putative flippase GtrA